jgi:small GTP-binding protein
VKFFVVGEPAAGKTTLLERLCGVEAKASRPSVSTDGIDLNEIEMEGIRFHFWDFGGQEVSESENAETISNFPM